MHPEDSSCTMLPNTMHFMQLQETRQPRSRSLIRTPTELITPINHLYFTDPRRTRNTPNTSFAPSTGISILTASNVYLGVDEDPFHGEDQRHIRKLLDKLHAR